MTRVIHTADTHIGYRQYHSPERREDFLRAFGAVVDDAIEDGVDAVVHAGDLFHDRRPELPDLLGTLSALRRLSDADIPFLAIVGNHESTRGGQWLDLFERLDLAERLDDQPRRIGDVAFYGLDHVPESRRSELDYDFASHDAAHAALVAHGQFAPLVPDVRGDAWDLEAVLDAATVAFDVALLGDDHAPQTTVVGDTRATYPGSTERASASEREARGYNLVAFGDHPDDDVDVRRRSLDDVTREFAFVSVDLAPGEGIDRVREQVRQHALEEAVAIVEITGDGDPVTAAAVEETAIEEGALVARVTDRRDVDQESESIEVSFADPDEAVRERIETMGFSTAALEIDETVRSLRDVADSNVRETVKRRVTEVVDDPDAFERPRDDGDSEADGDNEADAEAAADAEADAEADINPTGDDQASMGEYL